MTVSKVVHLGDKVDIRLAQEVERAAKTHETVKKHKSRVLDIREDGSLEIMMPSEGGGLVLLPLGVRYEFTFRSKEKMYRAIGEIRERYKKDNLYILEIELRSELERVQRREHFRYVCLMDIGYYKIPEGELDLYNMEEVTAAIQEDFLAGREIPASLLDISGGGVRFTTDEELQAGSALLLAFDLKNECVNKHYDIVAEIVDCRVLEKAADLFEIRAKFLMKDDHVREEIIRYIFEEERKMIQRGIEK